MEFFIALGIFFALFVVEFLICGFMFLVSTNSKDNFSSDAKILVIDLAAVLLLINFAISIFVTDFYHDPTSFGYQKIVVENAE